MTPLGRMLDGGVGGVSGLAVVRAFGTGDAVMDGAGTETVRRGGAIPMASCIDATRKRVTSVPHCTSARWAAVPGSWQSAKRT